MSLIESASFKATRSVRLGSRSLVVDSELLTDHVPLVNRKRKLFALAMVNGCITMAFSIMAPFFPREAELKGLTSTVSGLIFASSPLFMAIASPLAGLLLPKFGSRFQIISGLVITGVAQIVFGALTYVDQGQAFAILCFVVRSTGAIGSALVFTATFTVMCQLFPDNIGFALACGETLVGLGVSIGPALGGVLFSVGGFGLPFYFVGIVGLLAMPMIWILLDSEEFGAGIKDLQSKNAPSKLSALRVPAVLITMISLTISSISLTFLDPTLEPHVRIFDLSSSQVGLVFFTGAAVYAILSPVSGYISDKVENNFLQLILGQLLIGAGYLCLGPNPITGISQTLVSDILSYVLICIGAAAAMIPSFKMLLGAMTAHGAPDDTSTHSFVSGLFSFAFCMGEILGTSLGGVFVDNFGFVSGSSIVAIFNFVTVFLLIVACLTTKSQPERHVTDERSPLLTK
ncbi:MFS-type transporter SLC18B1 [Halotydeus destructor]|nr:MFS-type transporter SLC18B1 [Halotydeus destructor]KAI1304923.1 MFS-type transporter SLC18B1 [Halotydeus destructor]